MVELTRLNISNEVEIMEITLIPSQLYQKAIDLVNDFIFKSNKLQETYNFIQVINYSFFIYNKGVKKKGNLEKN